MKEPVTEADPLMNGENSTRPRLARLWKFGGFGVLGLIALAFCIGVVLLHARKQKQRAWLEIQQRLDALHAAGEPLTTDDLAKLYPDPPPEKDAKLLLAPAVAALREPEDSSNVPLLGGGELPPETQRITLEMRTNIEAILTDNQTALNALPWDQIKNAWVGSGFALGVIDMPHDNPHPALVLARMLYLKAVLEAESGNGTKAGESLIHSLALVHTFRSEVLLHHAVRRSGEALFCEILERVINQAEVSAADLATLEHFLSDDHADGFRDALMSVRCLDIWGMTTARALPNSALSPHRIGESQLEAALKSTFYGPVLRLSGKIYLDAEFSEILDVRSAQIAALRLPPKQRFGEFIRLKSQLASEARRSTLASELVAPLDLSKAFRSDSERLAKLQVCRVGLEIERWRRAHVGRAPDSLAELVPEFAPSIPLDPFDNNPLRYKKLPRGFIIYSIGPDFVDDGGKGKTGDAAESDRYDITFSIVR